MLDVQEAVINELVLDNGLNTGGVGASAIDTIHLADDAVTTAKIDDGAVTASKLGGDVDLGIGLTDLSVTQNAASGSGSLTYNNTSGVFSFTPPASSGGGGGGGDGIALTDLSVTQNAASGSGSLTYDDTSGVFTFTPPVSSGGGGGGGAGSLSTVLGIGNTTAGNNIVFGDSSGASDDRLVFGAGSDLQIYHDGSHSYIKELGGGNLSIMSDGAGILMEKTDGENIAFFDTVNSNVELFASGAKRLETTSTGVDVTGALKVSASSVVTASTDADDLVIEKTGDTGLSILSTTTGRIYFGDTANDDAGSIRYVHTDNSMRFETDGIERLRITSEGRVILSNIPQSSNTLGTDLALPAGTLFANNAGYLRIK